MHLPHLRFYALQRRTGHLATVDWNDGVALLLFASRTGAEAFLNDDSDLDEFEVLGLSLEEFHHLLTDLDGRVNQLLWNPEDEESSIHDLEAIRSPMDSTVVGMETPTQFTIQADVDRGEAV